MRPGRNTLLGSFAAAAILLTAVPPANAAPSIARNDSLLVSAEWLAGRLHDPNVVVLHVVHDAHEFTAGHIPGARPLSYMELAPQRSGIGTELPTVEELRELLEPLGVSDDSHVILYGEPVMAARAFFTLDYFGLRRVALLDGGLAGWTAGRRPVSRTRQRVTRGSLTPRPRQVAVDAHWVNQHAGGPRIALIDTRTDAEYTGTGTRRGIPSTGHIRGARQLQWEELFRDPRRGMFLDRASLAQKYAALAQPGDTVVTYCYVGYRASVTYFVARLLGYETRMYDGSYQDWAARGLPLVRPSR